MRKIWLVVLMLAAGCFGAPAKLAIGSHDFTIIVVGDQHVKSVDSLSKQYYDLCRFAAAQKNNLRIKAWIQVGDHFDATISGTWKIADTGLKIIEAAGIPFSYTTGNHEYDTTAGFTHLSYDTLMPTTRYTTKPWWNGGLRTDSGSLYSWFTVRNYNKTYLIVAEPYGDNSVAFRAQAAHWVRGVLDAHPTAYGILNIHAWLNDTGVLAMQQVFDTLKQTSNLRMVNSGHYFGAPYSSRHIDTLLNGNQINENKLDYQSVNNGNGIFRILVFRQDSNRIECYSFRWKRQVFTTDSLHQFSFYIDTAHTLSRPSSPTNISIDFPLFPRSSYLSFTLGQRGLSTVQIPMKDVRLYSIPDTSNYGRISTLNLGGAGEVSRVGLMQFSNINNFVSPDVRLDSAKMSIYSGGTTPTASRIIKLAVMKTVWGTNDTTEGVTKTPAYEYDPCYKWSFFGHTGWAGGYAFSAADYYAPYDSFTCVLNDPINTKYSTNIKPYIDSLIKGNTNLGISLTTASLAGASGTILHSREAVDSVRPYVTMYVHQIGWDTLYTYTGYTQGDTSFCAVLMDTIGMTFSKPLTVNNNAVIGAGDSTTFSSVTFNGGLTMGAGSKTNLTVYNFAGLNDAILSLPDQSVVGDININKDKLSIFTLDSSITANDVVISSGNVHFAASATVGDFTANNSGDTITVNKHINVTGQFSCASGVILVFGAGGSIVLSKPYTLTVGVAYTLPLTVGGSHFDSVTISPALPAGLSLDKLTGTISGTPTTTQSLTSYLVKVANTAGVDSCNVSIAVTGGTSRKKQNKFDFKITNFNF